MKNNNSNSLIFMKSDILNIHLTNTIHRTNDSIKIQSYTALESGHYVRFLGFLHIPMIDNARIQEFLSGGGGGGGSRSV